MTSPKFTLDKENAKHIGKIFAYTVGSAACVAGIGILASMTVPVTWMFAAALLNTTLVALQQYFQEQARN